MTCKKCGKPLGEAVRMGALKHVCPVPEEPVVPVVIDTEDAEGPPETEPVDDEE